MSNSIKIEGQWRRGCELETGTYMRRIIGSTHIDTCHVIGEEFSRDEFEYLGPIEIDEPDPVPMAMTGCVTVKYSDGRHGDLVHCCCSEVDGVEIVSCRGATSRQAILRHNAAVQAIMAMEWK